LDLLRDFIDLFVHLDVHLQQIISTYGTWTYGILFLVIFCETGLVVTPFLPGDSLLFAAGTFAALGALHPVYVFLLLAVASILGDNTNYWIGYHIGPKIFDRENVRFMNKRYLDRAHAFYEKHGGKTVIFARFMPIIRTFAPFVAGIGRMNYAQYLMFDVFGSVCWIGCFVFAGYFFGNIPTVKENFTIVIFAIILISVSPAIIEFIKSRRRPAAST